MNWHFALYLSVHRKHGVSLIGYSCTSVPWGCLRFVIVVFPDHTHYFCSVYSGLQISSLNKGAVISILQAIIVSYFTLDI